MNRIFKNRPSVELRYETVDGLRLRFFITRKSPADIVVQSDALGVAGDDLGFHATLGTCSVSEHEVRGIILGLTILYRQERDAWNALYRN